MVGAPNAEFFHAAAESIRVQVEELCRAIGPFDDAARSLEHSMDMVSLDADQ